MKINDFYNLIDKFAPFELSDRLCKLEDMYDNSGVIIDCESDIKAVTFALDFSKASVDKAKKNGSNLIVTHHPAIYRGIERIDGAFIDAIKNGIGVICAHLNLDCAKEGVDYCFARSLGAKKQKLTVDFGGGQGYGRIFSVDTTLGEFAGQAESALQTKCIVYGDRDMRINSVASFCGAGFTEKELSLVEADLYCSSEIAHHVIKSALDKGKAVMQFTHYSSEKGGIMSLYSYFCNLKEIKNNDIKLYFFDDERFV